MIAVCVRKDGIMVDGHAGYAEAGNDILCAAVFMLAQGEYPNWLGVFL